MEDKTLSRMGDTIRAQRVKYGMTEKQLAKKTGCAESFIKDVESGRRIPSDDVARRLLKAMGITDALGTELDAAAEPEVQLRPKPRPYIIPVPEDEPAPTKKQQEAQQASNDAWLDAQAEGSVVATHAETAVHLREVEHVPAVGDRPGREPGAPALHGDGPVDLGEDGAHVVLADGKRDGVGVPDGARLVLAVVVVV